MKFTRLAVCVIWCIAFASYFCMGSALATNPTAASIVHAPALSPSKEIARKVVDAYGGMAAIKHADQTMFRNVGKVIQYSTISGAANTFDCEVFTKGDMMRVSMNVMGESLITGYDGQHSWTQQGDQVFKTHPLSEKNIRDEIDHGLLLLEKLLEPTTKLELLSKQEIIGKNCDVLRITLSDGIPTLFYVDEKTHLVLQSAYEGVDAEQGVPAKKIYVYEDYRPMAGSMEPYIVTEYCGPQLASKLVLTSIEPAALGDTIFQTPKQTEFAIKEGESVRIPFEFVANEIIIAAKVNDQGTLTFVVDTGATQSILDKEVAAGLGQTKESKFEMTTGSGTVPLSYMTLPSLQLDTITLKDLSFAVTDLSAFAQIIGRRPSGLLGANVLRRFLVTVDYEHKILTLANPNCAHIQPTTIVVPAKPALGLSGLLVEGILDGKEIPFLVDTGAAFNNISAKLVKPILSTPLLPVGSVQGLDGRKVEIGSVQFESLKIGSFTTKNPVFSVAPPGTNPSGLIAGAGLAILGNPFWSQFSLTIDYQNQRLLLDRSEQQLKFQELLARANQLETEQLSQPGSNDFKAAYEALKKDADSDHVAGIEALCRAHLIMMSAEQNTQGQTAEQKKDFVAAQFKEAERMATSSQNSIVRGKVIALEASYYLDKLPRAQAVPLAKELLVAATANGPAEPSVCVATAKLLRLSMNNKLVGQIVDQALMLEPANWEALWLKYRLAVAADDQKLKTLVLEQLKRYYKDAPAVKSAMI